MKNIFSPEIQEAITKVLKIKFKTREQLELYKLAYEEDITQMSLREICRKTSIKHPQTAKHHLEQCLLGIYPLLK